MTEIRFDKTIAERLCAEAEEDDAGFSGRFSYDVERGDLTYLTPDGDQDCSVCVGFMEHGEDTGKPVARMLNRHRDLAAQLRAAMAEVERLRGINAESGGWIDSAAKLEIELRARVETFRNSMYALESRVTQLRDQLTAALAAKDEACEIATKLVAPVIEAYAAGPSDRALVEWSGPVTVEGGKPFETLARVTELRSIGKDGGNE